MLVVVVAVVAVGKRKILFHSIRTFMALNATVNWTSGDGYEI